ncbi:MAG: hypothetical protein ACXWNK_11400 [Vulcanimicrobiaceae bacterium]
MKKLLTMAALAATVAAATLPAAAANTVTIKWNVAAIASLTLNGNYTNAGAGQAAALAPLTVANGGGGNCAGGGAGIVGNGTTALTLDYGAITPDATKVTGCVGLNAAEAVVNTNDTLGVQVQEALTTAPALAGVAICGVAIKNNAPAAWSAVGQTSANFTAAKATDTADTVAGNWAGATCAGLTYSAATVNAAALAAAATVVNTSDNTTNPFYQGQDYAVLIPANASKGADQGVVTYTLITN